MTVNDGLLTRFISTAAIQFTSKILVVVYGVVFARTLGAEAYGIYGLLMSIITIGTLPIVSGLPNLIIKETSNYYQRNELSYISGLNFWSRKYVIICSCSVALVLYLAANYGLFDEAIVNILLVGVFIIPLKGYLTTQSSIINGMGKPVMAQIPLHLFPAVITLLGILVTYAILGFINLYSAVLVTLLSFLVSVVIAEFIQLKYILNYKGSKSLEVSKWVKMLIPFSVVSVIGTLNNEIAIIFLGFFDTPSNVAQFKVSNQAMYFVVMVLASINAVIAPKIASLYSKGSMDELQRIITSSVRISSLIGAITIAILVVFRVEFIDLLFGGEYDKAKNIMPILCFGQFINVIMGSVNLILNMTGNEKKAIKIIVFTLILNVILMAVLIPVYSAVGAAFAAMISMVVWNLLMAFDIYKNLGIKTWLR